MTNSGSSFQHWGFLLPPEHCVCAIFQHCLIYQLLQSGVKVKLRQKLPGMEEINIFCALCKFYCGPITNNEIKKIRQKLLKIKRRVVKW